MTIAYEQLIGRRVVGQSCAGDFAASASRTLPGDPDADENRQLAGAIQRGLSESLAMDVFEAYARALQQGGPYAYA